MMTGLNLFVLVHRFCSVRQVLENLYFAAIVVVVDRVVLVLYFVQVPNLLPQPYRPTWADSGSG